MPRATPLEARIENNYRQYVAAAVANYGLRTCEHSLGICVKAERGEKHEAI